MRLTEVDRSNRQRAVLRPAWLGSGHGTEGPTPPEGVRGATRAAHEGTEVLFAMKATSRNVAHIARAVALAHALRGRLRVLCVVPPRAAPVSLLFPHEVSRRLLDEATSERGVAEAALWVRDMAAGCAIDVIGGPLAVVTASVARQTQPRLVVVSSEDLDHLRDATFLLRETGVPILVARSVETGSAIVAATDLLREDLPVLRAAAGLASALEAPLVAVHNVPALTIEPLTTAGVPFAAGPTPEELGTRGRALESAVRAIDPTAEAVLVSEADASAAILGEARERDADLVVVGAHGGSWVQRVLFGSTAEDTLRSARRSVLLLPLDRET